MTWAAAIIFLIVVALALGIIADHMLRAWWTDRDDDDDDELVTYTSDPEKSRTVDP